jgi:elongation factor 1-alpha
MIVCCNKIDEKTMNYSKERYEEIKTELTAFLKKIGYKTESIPFVPISGFNGDNMIEKSSNTPWYNGPTLL